MTEIAVILASHGQASRFKLKDERVSPHVFTPSLD